MSDMKELVWIGVDESTMKGEPVKALVALRKAQKAAAEAKVAFEAAFIKAAHDGDHLAKEDSLAFGYRFGKLAVAKVTAADKRVKADTKPKFRF